MEASLLVACWRQLLRELWGLEKSGIPECCAKTERESLRARLDAIEAKPNFPKDLYPHGI